MNGFPIKTFGNDIIMKRWQKEADFLAYLFIRLATLPPRWIYQILTWPIIQLGSAGWISERIPILRLVLSNISVVFPEIDNTKERELLRQAIRKTVIGSYESGRIYRFAWINKSVRATGLDYLDEALAKGKGVIVLSAHLGSFPLILSYLKLRGYPIRNIGRDPENPYLARYFEKVRKKTGIAHIPKNPISLSVRESLRWLVSGKILSLPSDQYTGQGMPVLFFSQTVRTPTGTAVFARRLGCAVVPVSIVSRGKKHLIRVEPALAMNRSEDQEKDIRDNTALCNQVIEKWVREDPAEWFGWFTRRFR
ncbi:MAG: lysophospholipid acyltransferase family protein [Candidatus Ratteibacteria bacterium]|jgi:KDO2-lipid IV(A) lauroyltransferase